MVGPLFSTILTPQSLPWEFVLSTHWSSFAKAEFHVGGTIRVVVYGVSPCLWCLENHIGFFFFLLLSSRSDKVPLCLFAGAPLAFSLASIFSWALRPH